MIDNILDGIREECIKNVDKSYQSIKRYCEERPDIVTFIEYLYGSYDLNDWNYADVSTELQNICYESGYSVFRDEEYSSNVMRNLLNFIEDYFLSEEGIHQDPQKMIDEAINKTNETNRKFKSVLDRMKKWKETVDEYAE